MDNSYKRIAVKDIAFDRDNPRIKVALQKYGGMLDDERIRFALQSATENSSSTSSYSALKDSVRASGGISVPIVVWPKDNAYVCVDGNTRLAIYQELAREEVPGDWTTITCLVLREPTQKQIETIRVTAHLVGAREWPAYEKASYLHYLRNVEFMDYDELIARCGGNKASIQQQIDAYHDMNDHYRDRVSDDAFKIDRFSGFVELQKKGIKDAIYNSGFSLDDFGEWIRSGKIYRLADVRRLPSVLGDEEAQEKFVNGGIRSIEGAIETADANRRQEIRPSPQETTVDTASIILLAESLLRSIRTMSRQDFLALRNREYESAGQEIETLSALSEQLDELLKDVAE